MSSPPVAVLTANRNWSLSIVLYPSGPHLELVECIEGQGGRLSYSEPLANLERAAQILKENNPDA